MLNALCHVLPEFTGAGEIPEDGTNTRGRLQAAVGGSGAGWAGARGAGSAGASLFRWKPSTGSETVK